MKVIYPFAVTDAALISSTVAEDEYAAYSVGTDYAVGARVIAGHVVYESVQTPNVGHAPASSPLYWAAIGPSNRWAMFDSEVSTATTATDSLSVTVKGINPSGIGFVGVIGNQIDVTVRSSLGGTVVYSASASLDGTVIGDWYQYFWEPYALATEAVFLNLPPYPDAHVTVTISGVGVVACGAFVLGAVYGIGATQAGVNLGIIDYSRKEVSQTGVATLVKRKFSKRLSASVMIASPQVARTDRTLSDLRATPCIWICGDLETADRLILFGFYRDYAIDIAYPTYSLCTLEIEGLST